MDIERRLACMVSSVNEGNALWRHESLSRELIGLDGDRRAHQRLELPWPCQQVYSIRKLWSTGRRAHRHARASNAGFPPLPAGRARAGAGYVRAKRAVRFAPLPMATDPAQRTTLKSKVLLGFASVLAMLVIIATISVRSTSSFIRTAGWVANANEAVAVEERMLRNIAEMESTSRGFVATGDASFLRAFEYAHTEIVQGLNALQVLIAPEMHQEAMLGQMRTLLQEEFARLRGRSRRAGAKGRRRRWPACRMARAPRRWSG